MAPLPWLVGHALRQATKATTLLTKNQDTTSVIRALETYRGGDVEGVAAGFDVMDDVYNDLCSTKNLSYILCERLAASIVREEHKRPRRWNWS